MELDEDDGTSDGALLDHVTVAGAEVADMVLL